MKTRVAASMVFVGLLLLAAGFAQYAAARDRQRQEQEALDRRWNEVQRQAAQRFPRGLPGEERPAPAPLRGVPRAVGLVGAGATLGLAGLAAILVRPRLPAKGAAQHGAT